MSEIQRNKRKPKPRSGRPQYSTKPPGRSQSTGGNQPGSGTKSTYKKAGPGGTQPAGATRRKGNPSAASASRPQNRFPKAAPGAKGNAASSGRPARYSGESGNRSFDAQQQSRNPAAGERQQGPRSFQGPRPEGAKRPYKGSRPDGGKRTYQDSRPDGGKRTYQDSRPDGGKRTYQDSRPDGGKRTYQGSRPDGGKRTYQGSRPDGGKRTYQGSRPDGGKRTFNQGGPGKGAPKGRRPYQGTSPAEQSESAGYQRQVSKHRPTTEIMQEYIEQLIQARGEERIRIARKMATHERDAVSAVDRLLSSRDHYLRLAAAMVLSYVKSAQAIPALAHALQDPEATVRLQAASGLGEHRHPTAREALWYAFPDKTPGVSIAILRSLDKIMTNDMEDALRVMDTSKMSPRVQAEVQQILKRRASAKKNESVAEKAPATHVEGKSPLNTAPWLRMLPGTSCTGYAIPGTEQIAAALLQWRLDSVKVDHIAEGAVRFSINKQLLPQLVEARAFESIWVSLPRAANTELTLDTELFNSLYAFAHSKGVQSAIISGEISGSSARELARALGLRSTRPPGNPRTLRLHVSLEDVSSEFIAAADFPVLHGSADISAARALGACLCALTVGGPTDVLLDPFCGEGNVLIERALLGPMGKAIGVDHETETVDRARRAWHIMEPLSPHAGDAALFTTWDEHLKLELESHTVDAVATTLSTEDLANIAPAHLKEIARVLKPQRRAAFLVADNSQLQELLAISGWTIHQESAVGEPSLGYLVVASKE